MTTGSGANSPAGTGGRPPGECPFCDIVAGRAEARVVRRWPDSLAIVPLGAVTPGHLLVIPKRHVADVGTDPLVSATTMARAAELAAEFDACNIITSRGEPATQTVFHLHLHVLPRRDEDGLALPWAPGRDDGGRVTPEQADPHRDNESAVFQPSFIG
ncbi:HIT family protein [Streptomyces griseoviridis]|uniref:HIT domain-containing protein n=1 Tax=Streptomyces hintoniae TaxID=3075521 RepID=A0ABU2UV82_9ACTN|nr:MULTISPECIES: HIT domain-containing protein [unclassified Streptomyces]MDH6700919.1 diadenosine tetraphosphate (Ap4A) HIT family hydrolase [Streptomyces sp. MAA16]MDT0477201.1 HIT domain-containing protein [Streptomyces sp. DSM 41014]